MTRVKKNNKNYKKNTIAKILIILIQFMKSLVNVTIWFIVGFIYLTYLIIKKIDDLFIKAFYVLPRTSRALIIYIMIGSMIFSFYNPREIIIYKDKIIEINSSLKTNLLDLQAQETKVEVVEDTNQCNLSDIECRIYNKAIKMELSNEQAYMILSISKHETGNWTSRAFNNKFNLGGIMGSNGLKSYSSLDEGIEAFISLLKYRYFARGLDTIEKIQPVYAPINADNDPQGLNNYWLSNVKNFYNSYTNH